MNPIFKLKNRPHRNFLGQKSLLPPVRRESLSARLPTKPLQTLTEQSEHIQGHHLIGQKIGPFEIMSELGRGGMGSVYLARRDDGVLKMNVAIKFVRADIDNQRLHRRFHNERQILADLNHPNIARLLDAGATDWGQPFLVMEFIEGLPIDRYCRQNKLSVPQILALFQRVCHAVGFAHQNLVIHRDLKPSNVLINDAGEPILLDFGIAKILDSPTEEPLTCTGDFLMTPEYASPEQVLGKQPGESNDLYALAVMLFELLTGSLPYELPSRSMAAVCEVICRVTPKTPSKLIKADEADSNRDLQLGKLSLTDLDSILLKALRKEPHERYANVERFAQDIAQLQAGHPVAAKGGQWPYRFKKSLVRHGWKWAFATAAVLFVALTCCKQLEAQLMVQQALEKQQQAEASKSQAEASLTHIAEEKAAAQQIAAKIEEEAKFLTEAQATLRQERDLARKAWAKIQKERESLQGELKVIEQEKQQVTQSLAALSVDQQQTEQALEHLKENHSAIQVAMQEMAEERDQTNQVLVLLQDLFDQQQNLSESTLPMILKERLTQAPTQDLGTYYRLAGAVCLGLGRLEEAKTLLIESLQLLNQANSVLPLEVSKTLFHLAHTYDLLGMGEQAESYYLEAEQLFSQEPDTDALRHLNLLRHVAGFYQRWHQPKKAVPYLEKSLGFAKNQYGEHHLEFVKTLESLASFYWHLGMAEKAVTTQQKAIGILSENSAQNSQQLTQSLTTLQVYCCQAESGIQAEIRSPSFFVESSAIQPGLFQLHASLPQQPFPRFTQIRVPSNRGSAPFAAGPPPDNQPSENRSDRSVSQRLNTRPTPRFNQTGHRPNRSSSFSSSTRQKHHQRPSSSAGGGRSGSGKRH